MKVKGVSAIMIYADDAEALAAWYADRLGIESALNEADSCYYGEIGKDANGSAVHFGIYPAQRRLGGRAVMVNYRVDDIDAFVSFLERKGETIDKREDESFGRFAWFRDPEGNPIEIYQAVPTGACP